MNIAISYLEKSLLKSKNMEKESLLIMLDCSESLCTFSMEEDIECCIRKLVNALELTKIKNWRLIICFHKRNDKQNYRNIICNKLKKTYLAVTENKWERSPYGGIRIIVSNKECNICGYGTFDYLHRDFEFIA